MSFRNAACISVSLIAMALVVPVAATADPLVITNPAGTQTNDSQVAPGANVDSVNVTGNVEVTSGEAINLGTVGGDFVNGGILSSSDSNAVRITGDIQGDVINDGRITSSATTAFLVFGDVTGGFTNTGRIQSTAPDHYGVLIFGDVLDGVDNSGDLYGNDAFFVGSNLSGGFINSGNIVSSQSAVYVMGNLSGGFTNTGTGFIDGGTSFGLYVGGDFTGDFTNSGRITSTGSTGAVSIGGDLIGDFTNSGRIFSGGTGVYVAGNVEGNFTNTASGVIDGGEKYGVYLGGDVTGTFNNAGKIFGGDGSGVYIASDLKGAFTNSSTGLIQSEGSTGVGISGAVERGFTNAGIIHGGVSQNGVFIWTLSSDFVNSGTITGGSTGVKLREDVVGDFTNASTGVIDGRDAYGVYLENDLVGDFSNAGQITGGDYAVYIADDLIGDFTNTSTGYIDGGAGGALYVSGDLTGSLRNAGDLIGGVQSAVQIRSLGGDFANSGRIISSGQFAVSIEDDVGGRLTNGGLIRGGTGFDITGDVKGGIVNSGLIDGTAGYAISVGGNVEQGIENSGTLRGSGTGVYIVGDVTGGFTNHGRITGEEFYGVYIKGGLDEFLNTGEIESNAFSSSTTLYIQNDLTGDFINTGNMTILDGQEYVAYVGGSFQGNFTSTWGQGLYVGGNIDIQGKTVSANINKYVGNGATWTALQTYNTISGDGPDFYQGQSVTDNSVLLNVSVDQSSNETKLVLAASRNRISTFADSSFGLAGTLDTVIDGLEDGDSADGLTQAILDVVYAQSGSSGEINDTLASLSPDVRGAVSTAAQNQQMLVNAVNMRLGGGGGTQQMASLLPNGQAILPTADAPVETGLQMWMQGFFGPSSIEEEDGIAGADASTAGVAAGIDGDNGRGLTFGGAFAYAHSDGQDDSDFTINSYMPAVYGKWQPDAWYLSAILSGGFHAVDQTRSGPGGDSIDGDYNVNQVSVRGEAGWEIAVGSGVSFTPFVAAAYNHLSSSDFDESGSPFALSVDGGNESFGTYEAGAKSSVDLGGVTLNAMAGYRWSGLDYVVDAAFSNGLSFGTDLTTNLGGAFVDVDLLYAVTTSIRLGVGYDGLFGEDVTANYGSFKVGWTF